MKNVHVSGTGCVSQLYIL